MDYNQVLCALVRDSSVKAKRAHWENTCTLQSKFFEDISGLPFACFTIQQEFEDEFFEDTFIPSMKDLLAEDWIIIEEQNEENA